MSNTHERPPTVYEQALEAANDDPTLTELANVLYDLPSLYDIQVDGEDEDWRATEISVNFDDDISRGTSDVLTIMRRVGWKATEVCFAQNRITFKECDSE